MAKSVVVDLTKIPYFFKRTNLQKLRQKWTQEHGLSKTCWDARTDVWTAPVVIDTSSAVPSSVPASVDTTSIIYAGQTYVINSIYGRPK